MVCFVDILHVCCWFSVYHISSFCENVTNVFCVFWGCFMDDLVMFSGCFGNVF